MYHIHRVNESKPHSAIARPMTVNAAARSIRNSRAAAYTTTGIARCTASTNAL